MFAIVLEAAVLNEAELAECCCRGLYVEQIAAWRKACLQAHTDNAAQAKAQRDQSKQDRKHIRKLAGSALKIMQETQTAAPFVDSTICAWRIYTLDSSKMPVKHGRGLL